MNEPAPEIKSGNGADNGEALSDGNGSPLVTEDRADRLAQPVDLEQPPRLPFAVVGIGASAGGLEAYTEFLQHTKPDSGMAFVLIQHLSPKHTSMMAELLGKQTDMPVLQVENGMRVEPNHVYVIRPGYTMTIQNGRLHLGDSAAEPMHRRPVDDFFRSLAEEQRERAIAVILSGTGSNGTLGAESVKAVGGICIAQEPDSAEFPAMPRSMIDSNLADAILRPAEMFDAIRRYASHPYSAGQAPSPNAIAARERQALNEIVAMLRTRRRLDLSLYKKPMLVRRIQRRMSLMQIGGMADYVKALRQNPGEMSALSDDLMIHVTGFFRDPEVWDSVNESVIKPLVAEKPDESSIRCWVTACSSGEEAYTIGMLLIEAAEAAGKQFEIKIFATDTAERSLSQARAGVYPGGIESEIAPSRLARFFDKDDSFYRIKKDLRELVVFAPQNVLQDPPFSRLDLCTCRNLLIYIEGEVQRRVLSLLHFGLREGGMLLLGNSETIAGAEDLFEPIDKKHRIYRRIGPTRRGAISFPVPDMSLSARAQAPQGPVVGFEEPRSIPQATLAQLANQTLLEHHTPAAVVVDRAGQILYFHGNTEEFLVQPHGEPTRDVLLLAREEVRGGLRSALSHAVSESIPVCHRDGLIGEGEERRRIEITAAPLGVRPNTPYFLVSFKSYPDPPPPAGQGGEGQAAELASELRRVRDELQSTVEELQTSNEEMKASHEEVTSINEELQSTNEELETSKEELQSLNEELTTVNGQLQAKMEELERATNDMASLLGSNEIAVIFLDIHLRIRRFTSSAKPLIDLIEGDIGRPLTDLSRKFTDADLLPDATAVLEKLIPIEREIVSDQGKIYARRILPYRTTDNRIDGVVLTFADITQRKRAEQELERAKIYAENIVETLHEPLLVLAPDLTVRSANPAFYRHFKVTAERTLRRKIYDLGNGQWDIPALRQLLEEVLPANKLFNDFEVSHRFNELGQRVMLLNARQVDSDPLILLGIQDITDRDRTQKSVRESEERLRHMFNVAGVGVLIFDQAGTLMDSNDAFLQITGYSREDVASKSLTWRSLTPPKYVEISQQQLAKLSQTGRIGPYEKEVIRKDGTRTWILFAGAKLPDGSIVEYCIDVGEWRRAQAAQREDEAIYFRDFFENVGIAMSQSDITTGRLLLVNQMFCKLVGYEAGELVGMTFLDLTHPDDRDANWAGYTAAVRRNKAMYLVEKRLVRKDKSVIWVRANVRVVRDSTGKALRAQSAIEDISSQKRAEETLETSHAASLEADRIKDEFLANLSHELRTPLGAILLWTKLLQSGGITDLSQIRDGLNAIRTSAESQKELIEDLLDMSRIRSGNLRLRSREFQLLPIMRDALDAIGPAAAAKNVTVSADLDPAADLVRLDPDRLRQILWNLLTNAVKFTPSGGRVDVTLVRHDSEIQIRVSDTGHGIAPEFLPHVFERFRQADASSTRSAGGMGLGLSIVKQLVELHGGTISAESPGLDKGATFTVRFPQPKAAQQHARRTSDNSSAGQVEPGADNQAGRRVLLVEDESKTRAAIALLLRQAGMEVVEAAAAEPAMNLLEQSRPDLVISDIALPGEDGNGLIRRIRAAEASAGLPPIPTIALTAFARASDRQTSLEAGFDHHLAKPVEPDQLLAAVAEAMQPK